MSDVIVTQSDPTDGGGAQVTLLIHASYTPNRNILSIHANYMPTGPIYPHRCSSCTHLVNPFYQPTLHTTVIHPLFPPLSLPSLSTIPYRITSSHFPSSLSITISYHITPLIRMLEDPSVRFHDMPSSMVSKMINGVMDRNVVNDRVKNIPLVIGMATGSVPS